MFFTLTTGCAWKGLPSLCFQYGHQAVIIAELLIQKAAEGLSDDAALPHHTQVHVGFDCPVTPYAPEAYAHIVTYELQRLVHNPRWFPLPEQPSEFAQPERQLFLRKWQSYARVRGIAA